MEFGEIDLSFCLSPLSLADSKIIFKVSVNIPFHACVHVLSYFP